MYAGDWMSDAKARRYVTCAIIAIYAGFIFVSLARHEGESYSQPMQNDSTAYPNDSSFGQASVVNMESYSFPEGHPCYQAKNGGDPDLCQQWRMAEAAEELTGLTLGQVIVTVFEVCLLVSVLIYTARATRQAARSADATIETMFDKARYDKKGTGSAFRGTANPYFAKNALCEIAYLFILCSTAVQNVFGWANLSSF